jgi:hypothetical protein
VLIQAMHGERQTLAEMADDDLELRVRVEHGGEHDAQEVTARIDGEAPAGAGGSS